MSTLFILIRLTCFSPVTGNTYCETQTIKTFKSLAGCLKESSYLKDVKSQTTTCISPEQREDV